MKCFVYHGLCFCPFYLFRCIAFWHIKETSNALKLNLKISDIQVHVLCHDSLQFEPLSNRTLIKLYGNIVVYSFQFERIALTIVSLLWKESDACYDFYIKTIFGSSVGGIMSYLRYLCLFAYSGVQHILCCVFLRLVYPMLPVSLDCPFLISPSVFSNVYLNNYGQQFHQYERKQTTILPHFGDKRNWISNKY